jgi:hypothetical protein
MITFLNQYQEPGDDKMVKKGKAELLLIGGAG